MSYEEGVGPGGGPLMMTKDSLYMLIPNVLGREEGDVGLGRGPTNDDGGFFCFC